MERYSQGEQHLRKRVHEILQDQINDYNARPLHSSYLTVQGRVPTTSLADELMTKPVLNLTGGSDASDLKVFKVKELRAMCKKAGIKGYSKMTKPQLIKALIKSKKGDCKELKSIRKTKPNGIGKMSKLASKLMKIDPSLTKKKAFAAIKECY